MKTLDLETNEWRMQASRPHHHLYLLQENFSFKTIIEIIVFKEFEWNDLIVQAQALRVPRKDHACVSTRSAKSFKSFNDDPWR